MAKAKTNGGKRGRKPGSVNKPKAAPVESAPVAPTVSVSNGGGVKEQLLAQRDSLVSKKDALLAQITSIESAINSINSAEQQALAAVNGGSVPVSGTIVSNIGTPAPAAVPNGTTGKRSKVDPADTVAGIIREYLKTAPNEFESGNIRAFIQKQDGIKASWLVIPFIEACKALVKAGEMKLVQQGRGRKPTLYSK